MAISSQERFGTIDASPAMVSPKSGEVGERRRLVGDVIQTLSVCLCVFEMAVIPFAITSIGIDLMQINYAVGRGGPAVLAMTMDEIYERYPTPQLISGKVIINGREASPIPRAADYASGR